MKKLLGGLLCATAGAAIAFETTVSTIEVRAINSGTTNTIVAIPGLDLAGGPLAISNLVKNVNLASGDQLIAFSDGSYQTWELNSSGVWVEAAGLYSVGGDGNESESSGTPGTPASEFTLGVGSGIWVSRKASGCATPFYVYAQRPASMTSTIAHGETALVGNPTVNNTAFASFANCAAGDEISIPAPAVPGGKRVYTFKDGKWGYKAVNTETHMLYRVDENPSITAGTGFWYKSTGESDVTLNWE